ncbi:EthD domain-containing protein [Agrobacterium radiobacter]|uniref:EthD domain-containing protein n=1 Tax=Agrobacterium radiobacter TaxID=362 RepID=UPI003F830D03
MSTRIKKIAFVTQRPDLSREAFSHHWRYRHGPLLASIPGYRDWRVAYAQNHIIADGPVGTSFAFDGMAEFLLPGHASNEDGFAASGIYKSLIQPDELLFVDSERTVAMSAVETVLKKGSGPIKVVITSSRRYGLTKEVFERRFAEDYVRSISDETGLADLLRGWTINHVIEGSFKLPGARPAASVPVDCVEELWFASDADRDGYFSHPEWQSLVVPCASRLFGHQQSFLADELVMFDTSDEAQPSHGGN